MANIITKEQQINLAKRAASASKSSSSSSSSKTKSSSSTSSTKKTSSTSSTKSVASQVAEIQAKLSDLKAQQTALQKYNVKDTKDLSKDSSGNYVPKSQMEEAQDAIKESQNYFGYNPSETYSYKDYEEEEKAIANEYAQYEEEAINKYKYDLSQLQVDKQKLAQQYQQYIADLETGKIRVGEETQTETARLLAEKANWLQQNEISTKQNLDTLQRGWIAKGGLFSGVRAQSADQFNAQSQLQKEAYTANNDYNVKEQQTKYQQAMEDYLSKKNYAAQQYQTDTKANDLQEQRLGQIKEYNIQNYQAQKLKDMQKFQESYQSAIASRAASTLKEKYGY